ncbi:MAG TPA: YbaK/EbsC family protein [Thermofilum sp.]|nr:YbaK/EbsC family protein [Thermofilum sp.]
MVLPPGPIKRPILLLGITKDKIIKSILFMDEKENPILAIVTGDQRVDERKLAKVCNVKKVRKATPKEVKKHTGYEIGALPPVGHNIITIIDRNVLRNNVVYGGGGTVNSLLEIKTVDLKKLANAVVDDIAD